MKKILLSYCSGNYKDAFDFIVPSWVNNTSFDEIVIYTDSNELFFDDKRVKIVKFFESNTSWIVGTGRRLEAIKDYIIDQKNEYEYLTFLDIDCFVIQDFQEVFSNLSDQFDIGLTRLVSGNDHAKGTATAGVFFLRNNDNSKKFINDWIILASEYRKNDTMIREHKISYVQYSFTQLVFNSFHGLTDYKILNLSEKLYNSERSDLDEWYDDIRKFNPKILHFKGNRYQNKEIVEKVFSIYKDRLEKKEKNLFDNNCVRSIFEPEFIIDKKMIERSLKNTESFKDIVLSILQNENPKIIDQMEKKIIEFLKDEVHKNIVEKVKIDCLKDEIHRVLNELLSEKFAFDNKKLFNYSSQMYLFQTFKDKFIREVFPALKNDILKKISEKKNAKQL